MGARAPLEFGRSVNPIQTRGADYAPHTTANPFPPRIQKTIYTSANVIPDVTTSICTFRPFTFALHSLIGVGFLAATFLVKPFLPEDEPNNNSQNSICSQNVTETIATSSHNALLGGVPKIAWPFIISGAWCMVFCSGFAILSMYSLYSVSHIITHPSKELCCKMSLGKVGVTGLLFLGAILLHSSLLGSVIK